MQTIQHIHTKIDHFTYSYNDDEDFIYFFEYSNMIFFNGYDKNTPLNFCIHKDILTILYEKGINDLSTFTLNNGNTIVKVYKDNKQDDFFKIIVLNNNNYYELIINDFICKIIYNSLYNKQNNENECIIEKSNLYIANFIEKNNIHKSIFIVQWTNKDGFDLIIKNTKVEYFSISYNDFNDIEDIITSNKKDKYTILKNQIGTKNQNFFSKNYFGNRENFIISFKNSFDSFKELNLNKVTYKTIKDILNKIDNNN